MTQLQFVSLMKMTCGPDIRHFPNNRWQHQSEFQIYIGIDNQVRGQDQEKNRATRSDPAKNHQNDQNNYIRIKKQIQFRDLKSGSMIVVSCLWFGYCTGLVYGVPVSSCSLVIGQC